MLENNIIENETLQSHLMYGIVLDHFPIIPGLGSGIMFHTPVKELTVNITAYEYEVLNDKKHKKYSQDKFNETLNSVNERLSKKLKNNGINCQSDIDEIKHKECKRIAYHFHGDNFHAFLDIG